MFRILMLGISATIAMIVPTTSHILFIYLYIYLTPYATEKANPPN